MFVVVRGVGLVVAFGVVVGGVGVRVVPEPFLAGVFFGLFLAALFVFPVVVDVFGGVLFTCVAAGVVFVGVVFVVAGVVVVVVF